MSSRGRAGLLLIPIFISISVLSYAQVWEEDFESAATLRDEVKAIRAQMSETTVP